MNYKYVPFVALFVGLFVATVGIGMFFFQNSNGSDDDIQILSASQGVPLQGSVVVDVSGAVKNSGVYTLASDARVSNVVDAAGGLTEDADRARVNLAAKVNDGNKIVIPRIGETVSQSVGESVNQLVSINSGTQTELEKLPGVGPATAQKIISLRPYNTPDELLSKKAVSSSVYQKIRDLVTY